MSIAAAQEIQAPAAATLATAQVHGEESVVAPAAGAPARIMSRDGLAWCARSGAFSHDQIRAAEIYRHLFDRAGYSSVPVSRYDGMPSQSPPNRGEVSEAKLEAANLLVRINDHIRTTLRSTPCSVAIVQALAGHGHTIRTIAAAIYPDLDRARADLIVREQGRAAFDVAMQGLILEGFFDARR